MFRIIFRDLGMDGGENGYVILSRIEVQTGVNGGLKTLLV